MLPNLHILGIQGSGKGTQSELLVKKYGLTYISTGSLFRERAKQDDELGRFLHSELQTGRLIDDQHLIQIVTEYLQEKPISKGFLGDGVIRTVAQYQAFASLWSDYNLQEPFLIYLDLSEAVAWKRIEHRLQSTPERRSDDTPEAIKQRFDYYHRQTEPVIDCFRQAGQILEVNGDQSIETIHHEIVSRLQIRYPELIHGAH